MFDLKHAQTPKLNRGRRPAGPWTLDEAHRVDVGAAHGARRVVLGAALLHEAREAHGVEAVAARGLQRLAEVGRRLPDRGAPRGLPRKRIKIYVFLICFSEIPRFF